MAAPGLSTQSTVPVGGPGSTLWGWVLAAGLLGTAASSPSTVAGDFTGAGPFYCRFPLTLESGVRTEVLGPLWSRQEVWPEPAGNDADEPADVPPPTAVQETVTTLALAPFFSSVRRPAVDAFSWDVLYPLLTCDRYGNEHRLQLAQILTLSGGQSQDGVHTRTTSFFPFLYVRRSEDPAREYTAFWPVYGRIEQRLFRDEIRFLLWPLYVQTRKKDVITDNYLVPIVHRRQGEGLRGWQVWPLVGHEEKSPSLRTNELGLVETVPGHDKLFALWPFYFHNRTGLGTTNALSQRVFLPFYSLQESPAKDTRSYLWPLGPTWVVDRAGQYRQWGAPWPFLVFARGEGKHTDRVFPLFSHSRIRDTETWSYLWPLYGHREVRSESRSSDRTRVGLVLYTDARERTAGAESETHRTALWPLFVAHRDREGNERFQFPAPVEPLVGENPSVRRNWSPLWAIWRSEKNRRTGASSRSFLWNLVRCDTTPRAKKCSLLFGLLQYESGPDKTGWHLFPRRRGAGTRASDNAQGEPAGAAGPR